MKRMQGKVQIAVIEALRAKPMTTAELAMRIYGVKADKITLSQAVSVRRVLAQLAKKELVRESLVFTRDGAQCWVLDKAQIRADHVPKLRSV